MANSNKLFLYSLGLNDTHFEAFDSLVGKPAASIRIGMIENASDVIPDSSSWVKGIRDHWIGKGYQVETIDLLHWINIPFPEVLRKKMMEKDVIWIGGGHTYYLRWILRASGAEGFLDEFLAAGKVYAGWSAGAVVAGPSVTHFEKMGDDPAEAPATIFEGLNFIKKVIIPHLDNPDFAMGANKTDIAFTADGYETIPLRDDQAVIINGEKWEIL